MTSVRRPTTDAAEPTGGPLQTHDDHPPRKRPTRMPAWMVAVALAVGAAAGWLFWRTDVRKIAANPNADAAAVVPILFGVLVGLGAAFVCLCVLGVARWLYLGVGAEEPPGHLPRA